MSALLELQEKLRDTGAAIARYEQAIAKDRSPSLAAGLRSLEKRLRSLEADFLEVSEALGIDVCSYRLFSDEVTRPAAVAVCDTLSDFQDYFSTVYAAIKGGPKKRVLVTPELEQETALRFGYTFAGSVGIVLTIDNQRMLLETALDQSMSAAFDLASAKTPEEIIAASQTLGAPSVQAVGKWIRSHLKYGLGADIVWMHGQIEKQRLMLQVPEMRALDDALQQASEAVDEEVVLEGTIEGSEHHSSRRVHFLADDGETNIRCPYLEGVISKDKPVKSPARYRATFKKTAKKIISTNAEIEASYVLIRLKEITD